MSKRAEEMALKAYPECVVYNDLDREYEDINGCYRVGFEAGYEQAEKDTIEKAVAWLSSIENGTKIVDVQAFVESFKNEIREDE